METDFELFDGKSFKDLCKDIYANQTARKDQIEMFINDLRPLVKTVNDAMMVVPLIKGYIDSGNVNNDQLVRLAGIIQKLMVIQVKSTGDVVDLGLSEEEKKQLWGEIQSINTNDSLIVKNISPNK